MKKQITQDKCERCGSGLTYIPKAVALGCKHCGGYLPKVYDKNYSKHELRTTEHNVLSSNNDEIKKQVRNYNCPNCGGKVFLSGLDYTITCPYCKSDLSEDESEFKGPAIDGLIPFAFDEKEAKEKFSSNVKKKFFVSGKFKKNMPENSIKGNFIPSFQFDCKTFSSYSGRLSKQVQTGRDSNGHPRYTTRYFSIKGTHNEDFKDYLVDTSSHLTQLQLVEILPYRTQSIYKFNNDFLRGYSAERFDESLLNCINVYRNGVRDSIKNSILRKYHYDRVESFNLSTDFMNETYSHILLPIYRVNYKFKGKDYCTVMNGQTGKISGNFPKSGAKIAFVTILTILIVLLPIILGIIFSIR